LLLPQEGRRNSIAVTRPRNSEPVNLFRYDFAVLNRIPTSDTPRIGSHIAYETFDFPCTAAAWPVVVTLNVAVAPAPVGVTGFAENELALQAGAGDPPPLTLQLNVTESF